MMDLKNAKKGALDIIIKLGGGKSQGEEYASKSTPAAEKILAMHPVEKMSDEDIVNLHDAVCKELTSRGLMDSENEDESASSDTEEDAQEGE